MTFQQTLQEKGIETNKLKALFINYVRCSCCPFADACYNSPYNYCIEYIDAFLETENYFKISAKKILSF